MQGQLSAADRVHSRLARALQRIPCSARQAGNCRSRCQQANHQPLHHPSAKQLPPHREPRGHLGSGAVTAAHFLVCAPLSGDGAINTSPLSMLRAATGHTPGFRSFGFIITHTQPFIKQGISLHSQVGVFAGSKQPGIGVWFTFIFTGTTRQLLL